MRLAAFLMSTSILVTLFMATVAQASHPDPEPAKITYEPDQIFDPGHPNRIAVIEIAEWDQNAGGLIQIELYEHLCPITTANFIDLANSGFYDGIKFHRCIDGFVAQTGDPNTLDDNPYNDGSGGSDTPIPLEIHPNASHVNGAVGMARSSEPDTASSQFYLCDGPQGNLDDWNRSGDGYAVFGVVIEGMELVNAIATCETYEDTYGNTRPLLRDHPVDDIVMSRVYIIAGKDPSNTEDGGSGSSGTNDPAPDVRQSPSPLWIPLLATVPLLLILGKRKLRK